MVGGAEFLTNTGEEKRGKKRGDFDGLGAQQPVLRLGGLTDGNGRLTLALGLMGDWPRVKCETSRDSAK